MKPNVHFYDADGNEIWSWLYQYENEPLAQYAFSPAITIAHDDTRYDRLCEAIEHLAQSDDVAVFCDEYASIIEAMASEEPVRPVFEQGIVITDADDAAWRCEMTMICDDDDVYFAD